MRKLVSTHLFRRQRLGPAQLEALLQAGVEGIELFCARPSFDYQDRGQCAEIAAWLKQHPLALHSMHSPIYADEKEGRSGEPPINIADADPRARLHALDEVQRALEFSERVPFKYLVQHLGPSRLEWDLRMADRALTSLEKIRLLAKQAGIAVLVENIPNGLSQPERLLAFLQQNHLDDIGICFDSGHAHLPAEFFGGGGVLESWKVLGDRVASTHLHDNQGAKDDHLWPGQGTIAWAEFAPLLAARGAEFPCLLEVGDHGDGRPLAERIRQAYQLLGDEA
ncbi:MAG TPA: sugar phosphate isomerase/epimerase family protein [Terriglobales bacterium]|nr:sugar phosphate isomerase/epimerase family protein [Terriglobales bacterium]